MRYKVTVKAGSKKGPLIEETDEGLVIYIRTPAVKGKANAAVIKMLSWYYGVRKSSIKIKSGERSKHKLIDITE